MARDYELSRRVLELCATAPRTTAQVTQALGDKAQRTLGNLVRAGHIENLGAPYAGLWQTVPPERRQGRAVRVLRNSLRERPRPAVRHKPPMDLRCCGSCVHKTYAAAGCCNHQRFVPVCRLHHAPCEEARDAEGPCGRAPRDWQPRHPDVQAGCPGKDLP